MARNTSHPDGTRESLILKVIEGNLFFSQWASEPKKKKNEVEED
jgi:hypothetical protein